MTKVAVAKMLTVKLGENIASFYIPSSRCRDGGI